MSGPEELVSPRISGAEVQAMARPLELDLMAAYAAARDDIIRELHRAAAEGADPEEIVRRLLDVIGEPEREEWIDLVGG